MQALFKLICAKLLVGIDWTSALKLVKLFVLRKLPEVQREFIRTQHLHVLASSIAKLPDAFVSAAAADACSMVNLVYLCKSCLFMKSCLFIVNLVCL